MTTNRTLANYWRECPDAILRADYAAAQRSVRAFARVTKKSGSLIQEWLDGASMVEFEHYPSDDIIDRRTGYQFYYHAHRHGSQEHGHLHLFWHATRSGRRRFLHPDRANWTRSSPSHLISVSLDARGLPLGFFTVNQWVTDGYWFDADFIIDIVDGFSVSHEKRHANSCAWLTGFIRMYRPLIGVLLRKRDARIAAQARADRALQDRRLDVLSAVSVDWVSDLDAMDHALQSRCLV